MESCCVKEKRKTGCVEPSGYKTAKNGRLLLLFFFFFAHVQAVK